MPSPAPRRSYMTFGVYFRNIADFNFAQSLCDSAGMCIMSPNQAASTFGFDPFPGPGGPLGDKGMYFSSPFQPGSELLFPGPTGVFPDADNPGPYFVAAQAGNPASIFPANPDHDTDFYWSPAFSYEPVANQVNNPPPAPNNIPQRRWILGFEMAQDMEGWLTQPNQVSWNRDSSRTFDGIGLGYRGISTPNHVAMRTNKYIPGHLSHTSWERIYWRPRRQGATNQTLWRSRNDSQPGAGCFLRWASTGEVRAIDITGFGVERDQGVVFTPVLDTFYKIDILLKYGDGTAASGRCAFYIGGTRVFAYTSPDNSGMSINGNHTETWLGPSVDSMDANGEWDYDDWINANLPDNINPTTLEEIGGENFPIDWLVGSHVRRHFINPNTGSSTNWTGNRGVMNQGISPLGQLSNQLVSTTASARMEGITDVQLQDVQETQFPQVGIVAAIIALNSQNVAGTDGTLGYRIAAGGDVLTAVNQLNSFTSVGVGYLPSGVELPAEISPFHLVHIKSADANTDNTRACQAICEYLGVYGPEDDPLYTGLSFPNYKHNCRYFNSIFGWVGPAIPTPVYIIGATYVGNSGYQEFTIPAPAHFIHIRNTSAAGQGGVKWFASSLESCLGGTDAILPNFRTWYDFDTGEYKISVSGSDTNYNLAANTYQMVIWCDPGMRFSVSGQFCHGNTSVVPYANPLFSENFLPTFAFTQINLTGVTGPGTSNLAMKGPGHTGNNATSAIGNLITNWGTLSLGAINSNSDLDGTTGPVAYLCFRATDSVCGDSVMVQIGQYTGVGGASQVVNITPVSGRFPLAVLVVPTNSSACVWRDVSHTTNNSMNFSSGGNLTTGVTAMAIDQITVGSSINTLGVVYNYFIFPGDSAGANNGVFTNWYCDPTSPAFTEPLAPSTDIISVTGDGGIVLNGESALTLLKDISGIYTLVPGARHDTLQDRQTGQTSVNFPIPDPNFKTGYIGG